VYCVSDGREHHHDAGAREGAKFIAENIIPVAEYAFDDFAHHDSERSAVRRMLGLEE